MNERGAPSGDEFEALLADIDASLADIDQRLEAARRADADHQGRARAGNGFPRLDGHAAGAIPAAAPPSVPAAPPAAASPGAAGSDLLAELAREAELHQGAQGGAEGRQTLDRWLNDDLRLIFDFFTRFIRHVNVLAPQIPRPYRLDVRTDFGPVAWQGASIDYRRRSASEGALLSHVTLRIRLQADAPIAVQRSPGGLEALRDELQLLNLTLADDLDPRSADGLTVLRIQPLIRVQLSFAGDYDNHRINVICRNLEGFGISAFVPERVDAATLDELGRYLLGRSRNLPASLRRAYYRPQRPTP